MNFVSHDNKQTMKTAKLFQIMYQSIFIASSILFVSASVANEKSEIQKEAELDTLIVAGGCFWCVESDFEKYPGVVDAVSGYINGHTKNPTYKEVAAKKTGHYEAVKITYDRNQTNAAELTEYFWATIDPTDPDGQFCDKGSPYKTALFYQNEEQKAVFEKSLDYLNKNKPFEEAIATKILAAKTFYPAEDYHQDYYEKSKLNYVFYRLGCGRDERIKQLWGQVASEEIKKFTEKQKQAG